jgi:hypothetical protein
MRYRPLLVAATAAIAITALPAHAGAVKTLDGKKTKTLSFTDKVTAPQENDANFVGDQVPQHTPVTRPDIAACKAPRCATFSFVYQPAKGVKPGPFSARIAWTVPGQDYDLYVLDKGADVAHCGASAGTSEVAVVDFPVRGHKYTVVIDHFRSVPDTVKATVSFPAKDAIGSSVPGDPDASGLPVNCGLS